MQRRWDCGRHRRPTARSRSQNRLHKTRMSSTTAFSANRYIRFRVNCQRPGTEKVTNGDIVERVGAFEGFALMAKWNRCCTLRLPANLGLASTGGFLAYTASALVRRVSVRQSRTTLERPRMHYLRSGALPVRALSASCSFGKATAYRTDQKRLHQIQSGKLEMFLLRPAHPTSSSIR